MTEAPVIAPSALGLLVAQYRDSAEQRHARAQMQLAEFENDPHRLGSPNAAQNLTRLRAQVSVAANEAAAETARKVNELSRRDQAFFGDPAADPPFDFTTDNQLSLSSMRAEIADGRARGHSTAIIEEGFEPNRNPLPVVLAAREALKQLERDPDFLPKLAHDRETQLKFDKLSRVARPREDEY
jgi:hypothetical protein